MSLRIVYVSTLRPGVTDEGLDDLVEKAAAFNKARGITGILAIEGRRVCQILEGGDAEVEALFASIQRDPRHSGVIELVHIPVERSAFEAWGMVRRPMIDMVMAAYDT